MRDEPSHDQMQGRMDSFSDVEYMIQDNMCLRWTGTGLVFLNTFAL
jgi:hypothetical protein